ncbi:alpha/beta hydrolase [Streptomyces thermoalcalitolerans]|uniref:Alpha/beta hydrolase n=1 Tax=Streptomyces thermoalcalitolerans TaxID=65605 RepID=A0ABN1NYB7_9ACTN
MPAMSSVRRAARHLACAGAAALTLLGAGPPMAGDGGGEPGLDRFYDQKVTWSACGAGISEDLQCGKVTVPLDYARPEAGTLDLALARYRATGPSRGSVLLNFGGPGVSGVTGLAFDSRRFMDLAEGYDVVSFDPRGVGRSSPVSCGLGPDDENVRAVGAAGDLTDPRIARERLAAWRRLAAACAEHSGPVQAHMSTVDTARDLDVIRQALGDDKLNYLGFSYGTRLGAVYAAQFPGKVGRMALDGVDTLTESPAEEGLVAVEGQQRALGSFLDWCVQDTACPFGDDRRAADERVVRLVRSLDEKPVPNGFGGRLTGQDLVDALGRGLYSKRLWPSLERAVASLLQDGDAHGIEVFSHGGTLPARRDEGPAGTTGIPPDNPSAALMAVNCADDPDRPGAEQLVRELGRLGTEYERASPVFGRSRLNELLMCHGRPKGTGFIRDKVKNVGTEKMLLVGTRGDPATPYRWTVETARRLGPSAVVLDNRADGHTGYLSSRCVQRKVNDFLLYGSLPANGSSCGEDQAPPGGM